MFLNFYELCGKKKNISRKGLVVNPMIFNDLNLRSQVDPIYPSLCEDNDHKSILVS